MQVNPEDGPPEILCHVIRSPDDRLREYKGNGVAVCNGMLVIQILKWGGCHFTWKSSMSNGTVWICWQSLYAEISGFFTPSPPLMISNRQFYFHILKPSSGCYFTRTCRKHFAAALVGLYSQVISNIINFNMTWFFSPILKGKWHELGIIHR